MIQFNLLPDVKVEYVKAVRTKRIVILVSLACIFLSIVSVVFLFSVRLSQSRHLSNLNEDINSIRSELESDKDLSRILTVQNQLSKLPGLYEQRPAADRLLSYIEQTTPDDISITNMSVDFSEVSRISIDGGSKSLKSINKYVDILKYTKYKITDSDSNTESNAFKNVVLESYSIGSGSGQDGNQKSSYRISLNFDPTIFDKKNTIKLSVPNTISTHINMTGESALFNSSSGNINGGL